MKPAPILIWISMTVFVLIIIVGVAGFVGYRYLVSDPISLVKKSTLAYDDSMSIGNAFDGYRYFEETHWRYFTTSQKRKIVEFEGVMSYGKYIGVNVMGQPLTWVEVLHAQTTSEPMKYSFVVQLQLSGSAKPVQVHYAGCRLRGTDSRTRKPTDSRFPHALGQDFLLERIYQNQPDPFFAALIATSSRGLRK